MKFGYWKTQKRWEAYSLSDGLYRRKEAPISNNLNKRH